MSSLLDEKCLRSRKVCDYRDRRSTLVTLGGRAIPYKKQSLWGSLDFIPRVLCMIQRLFDCHAPQRICVENCRYRSSSISR
jgi:hypothetical protein